MKKFLAFILALACALSLMACGKKNNDDKPDPDPAPEPKPAVTTAEFTHGYVDMALDLRCCAGREATASAAPASPVRRSPLPTA